MRPFWFLATSLGLVAAEDGLNGWLRYARLPPDILENAISHSRIVALSDSDTSPVYVAGQELQKGIAGILGQEVEVTSSKRDTSLDSESRVVTVGTLDSFPYAVDFDEASFDEDGFFLSTDGAKVTIVGQNERGALYGAFEYLSMMGQGNFSEVAYMSNPSAPIRWVNQWDNMDGTIERGYAGLSIFFANDTIQDDLTRVDQYARLLASVRINGIVVNNVNADPILLSPENMAGLGRIADVMRPWGVKIGISLNFASPMSFGGLPTFDPLDEGVIEWWTNTTDALYEHVPDMAGYLVKANSEGQPGPITYNRTLAQGANLFAGALGPHGGIVLFRAFVYDHNLEYDNWYNDRANAQVEFFKELDGKFDANVVVQIKYGPIDFQVREPVSPLFAHMRHTPMAIELQVAQEYLGQQCHLVYLPPLWRTILDFDLRVDNQTSVVGTDILSGKTFGHTDLTGYTGVVNVGLNTTWLGSHLAMSNLYAYGLLAWDPQASSEGMLASWTRLTYGFDADVLSTITDLSMASWPAYENYTGNLGLQTLTDITGPHYGPNPASQDHNGWGQWTRATRDRIGMDRTVWNGTGNAGQYPPQIAAMYEDPGTTPDDLLLWFHHVPYTRRLSSKYHNKTVIQHFYDAHYAGAETAWEFPRKWEALRGKVDDERFAHTLFRLEYQAGHAVVWRDAITQFYYDMSGIPDEHGRVFGPRNSSSNSSSSSHGGTSSSSTHPWRIEAEDFAVKENYHVTGVNPFEAASSLRIVQTDDNSTRSAIETRIPFPSGVYDLAVAYYDMYEGEAEYELFLEGRSLGQWRGDLEHRLGYTLTRGPDGHSATRVTFRGVEVSEGATVRIETVPNGRETAPLDYLAVLPPGVVD